MEEEQVPRSAFVGAALALTAAAVAGLFGLHRPSDEDVAQLYQRRRGVGKPDTSQSPPAGERAPAALDDAALALGAGGRGLHQ